ncbi:MAG: carbohydrate porin [Verrucomicrobia bacterium]|nr:carbohydrate porin [Verrucomicrobiota bacterium]
MCLPVSFPRLPGLRPLLAASLTLLASGGLFAQSADQSGQSNQNDVSALKTQMQKMQKEYEDRISAMEAEMKSLESKADTGSILNTRILTDADGKEVAAAPTLDESFLKSLTRNFTFSAYIRAGFQFNGNGGGGNFSFDTPNAPGGRERLGNENDTYFELTWMQSHMLGDSPDVMDVSMTFTPAIRYVQQRASFVGNVFGNNVEHSGNDLDFVMRQAFLSVSNVFKTAPEITFWGGQRFYDRFNTDPDDYFWLDTSGYGVGVQNINVGIGQLNIAWIGGLDASNISPGIGSYFNHTFDVRLKNIDVGFGKLALVLIGNVEKGGTFNQTYNNAGNIVDLTNPVHTDTVWGIGGGAIYSVNFGPGGGNNQFQAYALFGRGITNFGAGASTGSYEAAESLFLHYHPLTPAGVEINTGDSQDHGFTYRAGFQVYFAFPWYSAAPAPAPAGLSKDGKAVAAPAPAPAPGLPWFSVGLWANWNDSYNGSAVGGSTGPGIGLGGNVANPNEPFASKVASGHAHWVDFGTRPAFWIADNIAIQGQFSGVYESNTTNGASGFPGFGHSGWLGVFDVGPVIKPKGGYFTRPEIRFFATYAIWSDHLKGLTTPIQENGGGDYAPPYNGNTNHGWLFGTQVEWYF